MKKTITFLVSIITVMCMLFTVSAAPADSGEIDFGELAGMSGDVNVDTYIDSSDLVLLRQILLDMSKEQSKKTADVNEDGNIDIRDLVRLKKTMVDLEKLYYAAGTTDVCGDSTDKTTWIYKVNGSGIYVREADIIAGDGDNVIEIAQLSDFHLMALNEDDEKDEVLVKTYAARNTDAFKNAEANAIKSMDFGRLYDKIYVTGDATDFLSVGSLQLLNNVLGNSGARAAVGNHEFRKVWYGDYTDTESLEDRYSLLEQYWPNNPYYYSEIIKEKVMCIVLNNGSGDNYEKYFAGEFTYNGVAGTMDTFLANDITTAKENGYTVLIFQHCPISTGVAKDKYAVPLTYLYADHQTTKDFYTLTGNNSTDTEVDKAVYSLITENADVIKGVFTGHMHSHFYTEIKATANGADTVIPQYTLTGNFKGDGCALKISVKY